MKVKVRETLDGFVSVVVPTAVMESRLVSPGIGGIRTDTHQSKRPSRPREARTHAESDPACRDEGVDLGYQFDGTGIRYSRVNLWSATSDHQEHKNWVQPARSHRS